MSLGEDSGEDIGSAIFFHLSYTNQFVPTIPHLHIINKLNAREEERISAMFPLSVTGFLLELDEYLAWSSPFFLQPRHEPPS